MPNVSDRMEKVVLIGRRDQEYWFVDSVFDHKSDNSDGTNFQGVTGCCCYPVSEAQAEEALSDDSLAERYCDYWHEISKEMVSADCKCCDGEPNEEGCDDCDYQSLLAFCSDIRQYDGYDGVFDYPGYEYEEALTELHDDIVTVDCSGCGRIFSDTTYNSFDKVFDKWALRACIEFEGGRISYDCAVSTIYGSGRSRYWGIIRVMTAMTIKAVRSFISN